MRGHPAQCLQHQSACSEEVVASGWSGSERRQWARMSRVVAKAKKLGWCMAPDRLPAMQALKGVLHLIAQARSRAHTHAGSATLLQTQTCTRTRSACPPALRLAEQTLEANTVCLDRATGSPDQPKRFEQRFGYTQPACLVQCRPWGAEPHLGLLGGGPGAADSRRGRGCPQSGLGAARLAASRRPPGQLQAAGPPLLLAHPPGRLLLLLGAWLGALG